MIANGPGPEWLDVMIGTNPHAKVLKHNKRNVKMADGKVVPNATPFEIEFTCPQLKTNDQGHKLCAMYENRPEVCSAYNCFDKANKLKRRPQGWQKVKKAIKEVHGIDVVWHGPLYKNPGSQVKKGLETIGIKEIN